MLKYIHWVGVGGNEMLKILRVLLSVIVIMLGSYSLITQNFEVMPYTFIILGMLFLITGSLELKAKREINAIISILAALFILFVAIYIF